MHLYQIASDPKEGPSALVVTVSLLVASVHCSSCALSLIVVSTSTLCQLETVESPILQLTLYTFFALQILCTFCMQLRWEGGILRANEFPDPGVLPFHPHVQYIVNISGSKNFNTLTKKLSLLCVKAVLQDLCLRFSSVVVDMPFKPSLISLITHPSFPIIEHS